MTGGMDASTRSGSIDLSYTRSTEQSKKLNFMREPAIMISASGMAETGRILHHLRNRIEDPHTTVLIVGWQADNTLGRRLVEHAPVVRIFGENTRTALKSRSSTAFPVTPTATNCLRGPEGCSQAGADVPGPRRRGSAVRAGGLA